MALPSMLLTCYKAIRMSLRTLAACGARVDDLVLGLLPSCTPAMRQHNMPVDLLCMLHGALRKVETNAKRTNS